MVESKSKYIHGVCESGRCPLTALPGQYITETLYSYPIFNIYNNKLYK